MRFTTIALGVKDLDTTRKFWVDFLGCRVAATFKNQLVIQADPFEILFDMTGEIKPAAGVEIMIQLDRKDLEQTMKILDAANAPVVRTAKDYGGPLGFEVTYSDPSGYKVCLFSKE